MIDYQERLLAEVGSYATNKTLHDHLSHLLGPEPLESYEVLGYIFTPEEALFRAFVLTPDRFIVFEMLNSGEHLIVTLPIERICRISEAGTAQGLAITIEMDADTLRTTTTGETAAAIDAIAAGESPVTRGSLREESLTSRANYIISATKEVAAGYENLKEFSQTLRSSIGR